MASRSVSRSTRRDRDAGPGLGSSLVKLVLWIGLPLAILYAVLWWRVDAAVRQTLDQARGVVDATHAGTRVGINGDVILKRLRLVPRLGGDAFTLRAERLVVQTPGLWWLFRTSLFGMPREVPSRLGLVLEEYYVDMPPRATGEQWLGSLSGMPFDTAGCQREGWMREDLREMGLSPGASDMSLRLERRGAEGLGIHYHASTPGVGGARATMQFAVDPRVVQSPELMMGARIEEVRWVFSDEGFIAARNRHCANRHRMSEPEFVQRHVEAVRRLFASQFRLEPGAAVTQAYAQFAGEGGEMELSLRPNGGMPLMQAAQMSQETPASFLTRMNAMLRVPGLSPAPMNFLPVSSSRPQTQAAADATAAGGEAGAPDAPQPPRAVDSSDVGEVIPFETLANLLGAQIQVRTTHGTVREGRLEGYGSNAIRLHLVAEQGGFQLSIPRYSVAEVRLLSLPDAPPTTDSDAKTN